MAFATQFKRALHDLWERRTSYLGWLLGISGRGRPKLLNKRVREQRIEALLELCTSMLRSQARTEFLKVVHQARRKHLEGPDSKRFVRMWNWARATFKRPIIYAFWKGKRCLYVGKGKRPSRLKSYENHTYLRDADLLQVYELQNPSSLPKAECLAAHLFMPGKNRAKPARLKWGKACPICSVHHEIKRELRTIFALRT